MSTLSLQHQDDALGLLKYPRTPHLEGSRLQAGDEGSDQVPYTELAGCHIVVEEKLDGANTGLSFDQAGELRLQSRGHFLAGGGRERQFALFKRWARAHEQALLACLEDRYVLYAEWLHKKHSVFYDQLPTYVAEFDVWDRARGLWLDTPSRAALLHKAPVLAVPVLYCGVAPRKLSDLRGWVRHSLGKSVHWRSRFEQVAAREGLDQVQAWRQCDHSDLAEGLYLKVEEAGRVVARYKWVRADFVQAILDAGQHHSQQPFVPNQLVDGVDIYSPTLTHDWQGPRKPMEERAP